MTTTDLENGGVIRRLMRGCTRVGLGTLTTGGDPYVSLAMVALDHDAAPLLYLSDLADHTRNLKADSRVSLLFDGTLDQRGAARRRAGDGAGPDRAHRRRAHAGALCGPASGCGRVCQGFRDFNLYRVTVERAHLVAGFGRIHWVDGEAVTLGRRGCRRTARVRRQRCSRT